MLQKIKIDTAGPQSAFFFASLALMDKKPDVAMRRWHDYDWEAVLAGQKVAQTSKFAWQIFALGGTILGQQPSWLNDQLAFIYSIHVLILCCYLKKKLGQPPKKYPTSNLHFVFLKRCAVFFS